MKDGDTMHAWFKLVPTYLVGSAIYCDRQCDTLSDVRKAPFVDAAETSPDKWAFENMTTDLLLLIVHFFGWILVIMVIEKGWMNFMRCRMSAPV
jgi:hypothetical protein